MIATLTGSVTFSSPENGYVVVDVGGVGYKVFVSSETLVSLQKEKKEVSLWTYHAVREQALDLYGFLGKTDLDFFELLLTVSGIGPKSALGVLSVASAETLTSAIASGDTSYLTKVSGIGRKSAEKIVVMLRDKIGSIEGLEGDTARQNEVDALEALRALGYGAKEARDALKSISSEIVNTDERIKAALKALN